MFKLIAKSKMLNQIDTNVELKLNKTASFKPNPKLQ